MTKRPARATSVIASSHRCAAAAATIPNFTAFSARCSRNRSVYGVSAVSWNTSGKSRTRPRPAEAVDVGEGARGGHARPARVGPDDLTTRSDHPGKVAGDGARPAPDLKHAGSPAHAREPEEAAAKPRVARRLAALLEPLDELCRIGLRVDGAVGIHRGVRVGLSREPSGTRRTRSSGHSAATAEAPPLRRSRLTGPPRHAALRSGLAEVLGEQLREERQKPSRLRRRRD